MSRLDFVCNLEKHRKVNSTIKPDKNVRKLVDARGQAKRFRALTTDASIHGSMHHFGIIKKNFSISALMLILLCDFGSIKLNTLPLSV
ncbi:hypothetical protein [Pantoea ananatis]|uniref:hypothetical protein n=1 Tax=Pantoea ananas TaxID=553 RepID=UPI0004900E32|nr:hypothetical protein [Pantoea ananatis]